MNQTLLTTFTYEPSDPWFIQTFPIPAKITELGLVTSTVVVRVESNWGSDYTCLYRVSTAWVWPRFSAPPRASVN